MRALLWQCFVHAAGRCCVQARSEIEARAILAANAWDKRDPGWTYDGTAFVPSPPYADWGRLAQWAEGGSG